MKEEILNTNPQDLLTCMASLIFMSFNQQSFVESVPCCDLASGQQSPGITSLSPPHGAYSAVGDSY